MNIKRGDIFLAALDPVAGREIAQTRPVVIVSNNLNNTHGGTVTILPITSQKLNKAYPFELILPKGSGNLPKKSKVKADQIRPLDRTRLIKRFGCLTAEQINGIDRAMKIHLAL